MFSGIIQGVCSVTSVAKQEGILTFSVALTDNLQENLSIGASVAVNGTCLTVTAIDQGEVFFDVMQETLTVTALSALKIGSKVNIERSLKFGDEIGGHLISGHIDTQAEIVDIRQPENNYIIQFRVPPEFVKYIFKKGFIGVHGSSLTVLDVNSSTDTFEVSLIPETLRMSNLSLQKVGDKVNLEIDRQTQAVVDTVRNMQR